MSGRCLGGVWEVSEVSRRCLSPSELEQAVMRAAAATTTPSSTPSTAPRAVLPAVVATILTAAAAAVAAAARATTATTNPHTRWHAAAQVLDKLIRAATARRLRAGVPPRDQVDQDRVAQVLQVLRRAGMRDEKEGRAGEGRSVP